ncbi:MULTISPECIES: tartrate dehydrogenase [Shouchella]|uniref:tartrate dehydrogenase n=1 Tax=Shouchella TaxID=2893057 RepID=UPI00091C5CB8|nr:MULTISPECIES: tartrate dehydrogenase [Shouchella]MDO7284668.1 tartrate dehydrogenase [Shouchella clausii]MDO7304763.1 tartrate dehydrogenase [Shouchella clausii]PAD15997.1 tartrate dehydrogenase [Shouchella clausii]PAD45056.1 tartrate dehydrogenase [Shouchella clausii]PAE92790.1 tartrate dehydrogenase [Shouchella clausii]
MKIVNIASIPGDGVGREVVPEAERVLKAIAELHGGLTFEFTSFPWSCEYYLENGSMMPEDGLEQIKEFDSIFLGAVGNQRLVPDHISLWGLLIKIRREFEQVINVRPAKLIKGINSPLSNPKDFDLLVVRENSEGEYSSIGGRIYNEDEELAIQNAVFSRRGTERAMRYAFELAKTRRGHVTSATKSNGIVYSMPFWDDVFKEISKDYPSVEVDSQHIDALAAFFVTQPERFDVIVASNLFGDILTDIGAAIMGSIGIAPAANININGKYPSMFEPVHGSAPDIIGKGIANPIGQIWTAKMMLDHHGETELGDHLLDSIEEVTSRGIRTPDIGGTSSTTEVTSEIIKTLLR